MRNWIEFSRYGWELKTSHNCDRCHVRFYLIFFVTCMQEVCSTLIGQEVTAGYFNVIGLP